MGASGLPVRRYLTSLAVAAVAFMALAIVDQRQTFLSALSPARTPVAPRTESTAAGERAVRVVRAFDAAVERAHALQSATPLVGVAMAERVRAEVALELADPVAGPAAAGLRLAELTVLSVEPAAGGWQVTTDETWVTPAGSRSRLRFRYELLEQDGDLRVEEVTPVLPEPR